MTKLPNTTTFDPSMGFVALVEMLAVLFLVYFVFIFAGYVVKSLINMRIAQKSGHSAWIAWMPFGYSITAMKIRNKPWYFGLAPLLIFPLAMMGLEWIWILGITPWIIYVDRSILASFGKDRYIAFFHLLPGFGTMVVMIIITVIAFGDAEYRDVY